MLKIYRMAIAHIGTAKRGVFYKHVARLATQKRVPSQLAHGRLLNFASSSHRALVSVFVDGVLSMLCSTPSNGWRMAHRGIPAWSFGLKFDQLLGWLCSAAAERLRCPDGRRFVEIYSALSASDFSIWK